MAITLTELVDRLGVTVDNPLPGEVWLQRAAALDEAGDGDLVFLGQARLKDKITDCKATACLIKPEYLPETRPENLAFLLTEDPERVFIEALRILYPAPTFSPGIHATAVVDNDAQLADSVHIDAHVRIHAGVEIGAGSAILAGAVIGENVSIGENCVLHPRVVIYPNAVIGDNVIIHAGAVIGADGFGYKLRDGRHIKMPHVGRVRIENDVEIGAGTTIDRATLGETMIGQGTKIDNLVQIGHNNRIGNHVIICGQTGISGSCRIDDYAVLAGSVGLADHVHIGAQSVIMARSGVAGDVPAKAQMFGSPAKDKKTAWQELAAIARLPKLLQKIKTLEQRLNALEELAND
ncbi:MAG: UDP-3-O-(3-hydroxymyristoyl)glucosamine N-acyltransferase [Methylococcales bacterium]|nr:UDP-3-O-(3-hydroxymyristoyl)glucosamine N-acyltransferase [Methylococcales bacterium]